MALIIMLHVQRWLVPFAQKCLRLGRQWVVFSTWAGAQPGWYRVPVDTSSPADFKDN